MEQQVGKKSHGSYRDISDNIKEDMLTAKTFPAILTADTVLLWLVGPSITHFLGSVFSIGGAILLALVGFWLMIFMLQMRRIATPDQKASGMTLFEYMVELNKNILGKIQHDTSEFEILERTL